MQTENGAQRAQRRAAAHGLTVGRSVAAQCRGWLGFGDPPSSRRLVPYGERTYAGPMGAPPLEFGERMSNYRLQQAVRTHHVGGTRWRPTPRQLRRLNAKARKAYGAAGPLIEAIRPTPHETVTAEPTICAESATIGGRVEVCTNPQGHTGTHHDLGSGTTWPPTVTPSDVRAKPQRERSAINPNGFRVVDRRGEHR